MKPPPPIPLDRLMHLPRWLFWLAVAGLVCLVLGVALVTHLVIKPAPPRQLTLTTGPPGSDYHNFGLKYQAKLAQHGVELRLLPSAGSPENLIRLTATPPTADVGFFQGGTGYSANAPDLISLGSLYYEPFWVFYRGATITDLTGLSGKRIAIGTYDSGVRALGLQLLALNAVVLPPTTLVDVGERSAVDQLRAGQLDAIMLVGSIESELVQMLLFEKDIKVLSLERADAYARRFPFLTKVVLPEGVLDFASNVPSADVVTVAPTASLLAHESIHPALVHLLLRAASEIHGGSGLFNNARTFPNMQDADFPFSDEVTRYYRSGSPFLQQRLPFWLANLVERLWVLLLPALAVGIPITRAIPPLLRWWRNSRIYRWYGRLKEIEIELDGSQDQAALSRMLLRLDEIEKAVSKLRLPLAYAANLYSFRTNIQYVRQRVINRMRPSSSTVASSG